jgi:hypothetical protein
LATHKSRLTPCSNNACQVSMQNPSNMVSCFVIAMGRHVTGRKKVTTYLSRAAAVQFD